MSSERARELRQQGIAAAKAGDKEQARQLLQQSIRLEPGSESAWLWLASVARDGRERAFCLQRILEINPSNEQAQKALRQLQEKRATTTGEMAPPAVTEIKSEPVQRPPSGAALTTQEIQAQLTGIPQPSPESIQQARQTAEGIVHTAIAPALPQQITWVQKTKNRIGERDIWRLRGIIAGVSLAALSIFCVISYVVVLNTPPLAAIVFAPTPTMTVPPTLTMTPTPGMTPTPSPTPRFTPQPSATVPVAFPTANIYSPEATDIYPEIIEPPIRGAVSLIDSGRAEDALPTLEVERANTSTRFNASPYYFEAIALMETGEINAALRVLGDAEERLGEAATGNLFDALINSGYAIVRIRQAELARDEDEDAQIQTLLENARERAEAAILRDPRLTQAHIMLARSYALAGDFRAAQEALDTGLSEPSLEFDTNLLVEKARLYFAQGNVRQAERYAYLTLYIDPTIEQAHLIQVESALRERHPGLAVIYAQAYLYYYPGRANAWRLLGDARLAEGNADLAVQAYSQALVNEQDETVTAAALQGRGNAWLALGRFDDALDDLSRAYDLAPNEPLQVLRMQAAYAAGDLEQADADARDLAGSQAISAAALALLRGRIMVDQAVADEDAPGEEAIGLLEAGRVGAQPAVLGLIDQYVAQANLLNGDLRDALEAVDIALERGQTAERYYLRGQILERLGNEEDAITAYEWVVSWSGVYPLPFAQDAAERLAALREET